MVVIWGLDLREMQWGKFKSSYMFGNTDYHLRRTKFAVYQAAMITCVVSESLGTAVLSDMVSQQKRVASIDHRAVVHNDDYVGVASYNIFVGIYVATIFGSGFFFDLFWPERKESSSVKLAWRICSVIACALILATVIAETIIVASRSAYVTGGSIAHTMALVRQAGGPALAYSGSPRAIASLVFAWIGLPSVIASTIILWMSLSYIDKNGPFSAHVTPKQRSSTTTSDEEMGETKMEPVAPGTSYPPVDGHQAQYQTQAAPPPPASNGEQPVRVYQGT